MSDIDIENQLAKILSESPSAPFLFIGSGFSRRYINMPDWKGLLSQFSRRPFIRYLGMADGDVPKAALALANDFHEEWFEKNEQNKHIYEAENWLNKIETPLKYEISKFLQSYTIDDSLLEDPELIDLISDEVVIDGIITTNWDLLLEKIFPKLKVYVGQSDILFKHPQAVGEIFKIHGSCSDFNSLILSSNDYADFNQKNPYLASKLISIFLEKPVIFLGYSLSDNNITDLLEKIEKVIDSEDRIVKLSKNMIFVTRANGSTERMTCVEMPINDKRLTFTHIKTDDFGKIYRALQYAERKIPVDFLRVFKEQIYSIVNSREKADLRLKYVDFDNAIKGEDIEFVAGVGVASNSEYGKKGLSGIDAMDLVRDIVFDHLEFSDDDIALEIPSLVKKTYTYLPIRKYFLNSNIKLPTRLENKQLKKRKKSSTQTFLLKIQSNKSISRVYKEFQNPNEIVKKYSEDINKTTDVLGVWLAHNKTLRNCESVREVLRTNYDVWLDKANETNFKRLVCILDEIENNDLKP